MIAFVTLLLGVVFGVQTVELSAGPQVARVELYIDGTRAAELGPPWRATIDLGDEIAPHELVAVALDESGQRLGEARQWVNRATSAAEAGFVLERDDAGHPVAARVVWRCPESPDPTAISVSFDGRPLEVANPERIPLPAHATGASHILLADLAFPGGITATAVASFGGRKTDDALQELTAVPVRISPGARLPKVDQMVGWFEAGGRTLRVAAVEEGPAEVVFVLADSVREELQRLASEDYFPWPWPRPRPLELAPRSRFRFMITTPQLIDGSKVVTRVYPSSDEYTPAKGSFLRLGKDAFLNELSSPPESPRRSPRPASQPPGASAAGPSSSSSATTPGTRAPSTPPVPGGISRGSAFPSTSGESRREASPRTAPGPAHSTPRRSMAWARRSRRSGRIWRRSASSGWKDGSSRSAVDVTPEARGIVTVR